MLQESCFTLPGPGKQTGVADPPVTASTGPNQLLPDEPDAHGEDQMMQAADQPSPELVGHHNNIQTETQSSVAAFIQTSYKPAGKAILNTPARKIKTAMPDVPAIRRSGRLAEKAQKKGPMCAEKMAQEVLYKKLEGAAGEHDKEKQARERLIRMFDAPLPDEAIEAIEDLLKVINLEGNKSAAPKKGGRKAAICPA
jgi:hypothetical protein